MQISSVGSVSVGDRKEPARGGDTRIPSDVGHHRIDNIRQKEGVEMRRGHYSHFSSRPRNFGAALGNNGITT